jgi:Domain of unknown function (DUF4157)
MFPGTFAFWSAFPRLNAERRFFLHACKHGILSRLLIAAALAFGLYPFSTAVAGGLLGDLVNKVVPGAGTALDQAHRQIKNAIPPYKAIEEGATRMVNEALVQASAPALIELIARSRDDALRSGVQPVPQFIRQNLTGFISDQILNIARYRVKGGGDLTLQVNAIKYGEVAAITLDYVIIFANDNDAQSNPTLWAHELTHVDQYQRWGIHDFAVRYIRSYSAVESEAYEAETRYAAWVAVQNAQQFAATGSPATPNSLNHPVAPFPGMGSSDFCATGGAGNCRVNGSAPVGTPCWCSNPSTGAAMGSLIPTSLPRLPVPSGAASSAGQPSGFNMTACGCWGPNPSPTGPEPRCGSGTVRIEICPGFCAPRQPVYHYRCM